MSRPVARSFIGRSVAVGGVRSVAGVGRSVNCEAGGGQIGPSNVPSPNAEIVARDLAPELAQALGKARRFEVIGDGSLRDLKLCGRPLLTRLGGSSAY